MTCQLAHMWGGTRGDYGLLASQGLGPSGWIREGDVLEIEVGVGQAWNQHSNHCTQRNEERGGRERVQEAPSRSHCPSLATGGKMEEG